MEEETELNGDSRNGTDKNIRKMFGTVEDFLLTSMASQVDSLSFINEGSTKRKEILGKFLDLEIFDKKFKKAKEDASDMKGALKLLEGKEYDTDISDTTGQLQQNSSAKERQERKCRKYSGAIGKTEDIISEIERKIGSIPAEIINIVEVKEEQISKQQEVSILTTQIKELTEECKVKKSKPSAYLRGLGRF
jgi:chromosome segregation ATPase